MPDENLKCRNAYYFRPAPLVEATAQNADLYLEPATKEHAERSGR